MGAVSALPTLTVRLVRIGSLFLVVLFEYLMLFGLRRLRGPESFPRFTESVHRRNARRLRRGALRLGGVFIKTGQAASIMTTFLPEVYLDELESLQDAVPPRPFDEMRPRVERELGLAVEDVFASIESTPIASASLGQVHLARLLDGDGEAVDVAVKIQYPGLERIVRVDLWTLKQVLRVVSWFLPTANFERVHADLSSMVHRELDYIHEGQNCERLAANLADEDHLAFPAIHWKQTTRRVLTMERMFGHKITDVDAMRDDGIDPEAVVERLVTAYYRQLLIDRFFHADPHPGNFLVSRGPDGEPVIAFVDFGAVEEVTADLRDGMRSVVVGYATNDAEKVIEGMDLMGFRSEVGDPEDFEKAVRYYFDKVRNLEVTDFRRLDLSQFHVLKNLREMDMNLRDLMRAFQVPLGWFYIERTLLLLLQVSAMIAPTVHPFELGLPYAMRFLMPDTDERLEGRG